MININEWVNVYDFINRLESSDYLVDPDEPIFSLNDILHVTNSLKKIKPKTKKVIYFEEEDFDGEKPD